MKKFLKYLICTVFLSVLFVIPCFADEFPGGTMFQKITMDNLTHPVLDWFSNNNYTPFDVRCYYERGPVGDPPYVDIQGIAIRTPLLSGIQGAFIFTMIDGSSEALENIKISNYDPSTNTFSAVNIPYTVFENSIYVDVRDIPAPLDYPYNWNLCFYGWYNAVSGGMSSTWTVSFTYQTDYVYNAGYRAGFDEGRAAGIADQTAYYNEHILPDVMQRYYNQGKADGLATADVGNFSSIFDAVARVPYTIVSGFTDFQIPVLGVSMWQILAFVFSLLLFGGVTLIVIKLIF